MPARRTRNPRIDALPALPTDPNVVEVRVGGRTVATLLRHRAEELGIAEGRPWTPALAARVGAAEAAELAREAALAFLARRAWASAALEARLVRAGHSEAAAAAAVRALQADGWLDDRAFARMRVERHRERGAFAAPALEALLEAEGIGGRDARAAADAGAARPAELHAEVRAARRAGQPAARVAARLARRGFEPDTIREALERAGYSLED